MFDDLIFWVFEVDLVGFVFWEGFIDFFYFFGFDCGFAFLEVDEMLLDFKVGSLDYWDRYCGLVKVGEGFFDAGLRGEVGCGCGIRVGIVVGETALGVGLGLMGWVSVTYFGGSGSLFVVFSFDVKAHLMWLSKLLNFWTS